MTPSEESVRILSDLTTYLKYARYQPDVSRRETWGEIVDRNQEMHLRRFKDVPQIEGSILYTHDLIRQKKILPSMRSLQFAGKPIELAPNRIYNCSFCAMDHPAAFSEIMFLLLGGTGVGYSVQRHHVAKLPAITKPTRTRRYLVGDSIEGWSDAVKMLVRAYLEPGRAKPVFDFSDIRAKGARLVTSGGKAPGPQPLKTALFFLEAILSAKVDGEKLRPIEVHDMCCHIADAVLAGGIRRAALISLFSRDDVEMMVAKSGAWWELNPQRGRANNSVVMLRDEVGRDDFLRFWSVLQASGAGEPGILWTNDLEIGTNPCAEISLRTFCNLTTVNAGVVTNQIEFNNLARGASFLGTLQAAYTNFHYLRPRWQEWTEEDSLLGVSITGIANKKFLALDAEEAALAAVKVNADTAKMLGIRPAKRITTVKPEGTSSLVLGTSSGIHAWHNDFYLRRLRIGKNEAVYGYLAREIPALVEDDQFNPLGAIVTVPVKAPEGAITRHEPALDLLERVRRFNEEWITPGHREGANKHNVSATISIREHEWDDVREWMWENREGYTGLSVLPYDGGTYVQAPFEDITAEEYEARLPSLKRLDLSQVNESDDETNLVGELACAGGACVVT